MKTPEFDITIAKDGTVKVKISGASGAECMALADMIKQIVGLEKSRELTAEYYGSDGKVRIDTHVQSHAQTKPRG